MTKAIVGIDLGTTHSLVGAVIEGELTLFRDRDGRVLVPSIVGISASGDVLVGRRARNRRLLDPAGTSSSFKREMGSDVEIPLGDKTVSPPEASALVLAALLDHAESALGFRPERAVITVPAYFTDRQRQATKDAAEIAGLAVERLVNEPTAAALTHQTGEEELVLVYDLGGGTFDVSILERDEGFMEVRSSHGDTRLGGDDIDARLADFVLARMSDAAAAAVRADPHAMARLAEVVERAKIELSTAEEAQLFEPFITGTEASAVNLDVTLSRDDLESVARPLLERTLPCIDRALRDAGVSASQLDRILLVGGVSQMPLVAELVGAHVDMPVQLADEPELAVGRGAAMLAGRAAGDEVSDIVVDIAPHALAAGALDAYSGDFVARPLIPRGTVIPTERSATFYTVYPNQNMVEMPIVQGDARLADDNSELGLLTIDEIPPSAEDSPVDVTFRLDLSGVLHVSATHRDSGRAASATIKHGPNRLTTQERQKAASRLELVRNPEARADISPGDDAPDDNAVRLARSLLRRAERVQGKAEAPLEQVASAALALEEALGSGVSVDACVEALTDALYDVS